MNVIVLCLLFQFPVAMAEKGLTKRILEVFGKDFDSASSARAKALVLNHGGSSVAALIKIMKGREFPWRSRWMATFLLGRVMGKKAGPFLATFLAHPDSLMRLAVLKTLLALGEKRFAKAYGRALSDKSLLVRKQALENIRVLGLSSEAQDIVTMIRGASDYRTGLIASAVETLGEFGERQALAALSGMSRQKRDKHLAALVARTLAANR